MARFRPGIKGIRRALTPAPRPELRLSGLDLGRQQGLIALIAILGLLVLVAVTATVLITENRRAAENALEAQNVPTSIMRVMNLIQRAESSQRGFLLTADPDYLALYNDSKTRLTDAYENLRLSVADVPQLSLDFATLSTLVSAKLNEMDEVLASFQAGEQEKAFAQVRSKEGKGYMEQIRDIIVRMWVESQRLSGEWIGEWQSNSNWLFGVQISAAILVLVVATIAGVGAIRFVGALENSERQLRLANESLEARVKARTADLEEVNEEVQRFAYIISHDLRSPLVNIMGFSSELSEIRAEIAIRLSGSKQNAEATDRDPSEIDRDFGEALSFIQKSANKMDRLISAILKLARSGQREFRFEPLPMAAIIDEIVSGSKHRAHELGAEIVVEDIPSVIGDRLAIEQIFSNLVDNALKYLSDERPGRIVLRGRQEGTKVVYEIEDNGRGIAEHDMARIFELFRRGGKQDTPGNGIGLAHLRILVRRLGGKISCRSELRKGSVFTVVLPQGGTVN